MVGPGRRPWLALGHPQPRNREEDPPARFLAVLPFQLLTAAKDSDILARRGGCGDHEAGYARGLPVRPTSAALSFAGSNPVAAGRALSVDAVLEGRTQESEGRLRVTVQPIEVCRWIPLWSSKFDVPRARHFTEDVFSDEVMSAPATNLQNCEEAPRLARN